MPGLLALALLTQGCSKGLTPDEKAKIDEAAPVKASAAPNAPRKLLVFNLSEGTNHEAVPYAAYALDVLSRNTGAFEVVHSEDMAMFTPDSLARFDAVVFNNTSMLAFEGDRYRRSLLDYVRRGKGVIGIHAATDNFYDWPEGAELMGGWLDGHPWEADGSWLVKIEEPEHPVMAAFKGEGFEISDQIYRHKAPYSREKVRVLMSLDMSAGQNVVVAGVTGADQDVPISWVRNYGEGRVFYCSFGHNPAVFRNAAVLQHLLDGIQFALGDLEADATPSVQLERLLADLAGFEYGESEAGLKALEKYIRYSATSPETLARIEAGLAGVLAGEATLAARHFVCRQLSMIGAEASVDVLSGLLAEPATSDMARYALEGIDGTAVDRVLREALDRTDGAAKAGIITSLGERGDAGSVGALALDAYLECADGLAAAGDRRGARTIYQSLYTPEEPGPIRAAALRGLVQTAPQDGVSLILTVLRSEDRALQPVAISLLDLVGHGEDISVLAAELPRLPVSGQVQLLAALGRRGDKAHVGTVLTAAGNDDAAVREAALTVLAALGSAAEVGLLAERAASAEGREQAAARTSLYRLRGENVNDVIVSGLAGVSPEVQVELIQAIDRRRVDGSVKVLETMAGHGDSQVRIAALRALRAIATPGDLATLLKLLSETQTQAERDEARQTVVAVSKKIEREDRRAREVLKALTGADELPVRLSLIQALGEIEDAQALPTLEGLLADLEAEVVSAAIRALSAWPTAAPLESLLAVARSGPGVQQILALRGVVRLTGLAEDKTEADRLALYQEAMGLAANDNERKVVLSGISGESRPGALELAVSYLSEKALAQEVEAAVIRIAWAIRREHPEAAKAAMQKVVDATGNENTRARAQDRINQM